MSEVKPVIVYYSLSGNTKAFANRFKADGYEVMTNRQAGGIAQPFVLFTPTYNFGGIPAPVKRFLNEYSRHMQAVVSFGNLNWGAGFALAGEKVAEQYAVPLLMKIEMRGGDKEYEIIRERLNGGIR